MTTPTGLPSSCTSRASTFSSLVTASPTGSLVPTVGTSEPVGEAVAKLEKADALLVQEDGKPVGVVTRQDLLAYLASR